MVNGKNSGDNNDFSQASIFLPAVGRGLNGNLEGDKAQGHYWQSIPDDSSPTTSASLYFDNYTIRMGAGGDNYYRYVGMPIRPVYDPSNADGAIICEGEYDGNTIITEDGQTIVTENHEIDSIIESSDSDIANTILTYVDDNGNLQTASNKVTKFYPDDEKQKNMWPQRGKNRWRELIIGTACNRIANQACRDEKGLTSVTIRSNVESIGVSAFNGCTKLGEVKFLYRKNDAGQSTIHNLRKIEKYAFSGCNNLKKMMLPRGVQTIEVYAFKDCTNLQTVRIPSGVDFAGVDVNNWAFNTMLSCTVRTISDDTSDDVVYTNLTQTQRNKFKDSGLYGYYPDVINTLPANVTFDRIQYQNTGTYLIPKGLSGYYAQIAGGGIPGQGPTLRVSNSIGWHASYNRKTVPYGGTSGFWAFFD